MNAAARIDGQSEVARGRVWRGPGPEGRGHELLQEWALFRRGGQSIGPHAGNGGWSEPLDKAMECEPPWVVLVDDALAAYSVNPVYEQMVKGFYLDNRSFWEVAGKVQRTVGFVALSLRGICEHVESRVNS